MQNRICSFQREAWSRAMTARNPQSTHCSSRRRERSSTKRARCADSGQQFLVPTGAATVRVELRNSIDLVKHYAREFISMGSTPDPTPPSAVPNRLRRSSSTAKPRSPPGSVLGELQKCLYDGGFAGTCFPRQYGDRGLSIEYQKAVNVESGGYEVKPIVNIPSLTICRLRRWGSARRRWRAIPGAPKIVSLGGGSTEIARTVIAERL
jgi:hypothetical protein